MARYFNSTPQEYKSQFVPPNLELMYKVGQEKAAQDAIITDNIDKAEAWKLTGNGMYSDKDRVDQINSQIKDNLSAITEAFYSGKADSYQAARAINRLQSELNNNKEYNMYKADEAYTAATQAKIASGTLNNALGVNRNGMPVFDARNGNMRINYKLDPNVDDKNTVAQLHNLQGAGEFEKEHEHFVKQASVPKIIDAWERSGHSVSYETINGQQVPIFTNSVTGVTSKGITLEAIQNYAKQYADKEWDNSTDKPSVEYMRRAGETKEQYQERLTNLIMTGVTDMNVTNKSNANPITDSGNNGEGFQMPPTSNPLPGNKTEFGINREGFFNTTESYKARKALAWVTGDTTQQLLGPGPSDLEPNNYSELKPSYQKVVENYVKNSPRWKNKAQQVLSDGLDEAHLTVLYNEIADLNKDFTESVNYSNQTGTPIVATSGSVKNLSYQQKRGNNIWNTIFNNQSSATVEDLVNSQYMIGKKIYNIKNMEEVDKNTFKGKTDKIVGLTELTPENLLPTITGDPNMTGGFMFANGEDTYLIQNDWQSQEPINLLINKTYNDLKLSTGITIPFKGNPNYGLKMNKDGKVTVHEKTSDGYNTKSINNSEPMSLLLAIKALTSISE